MASQNPDMPWWLNAAEALPHTTAAMGWQSFRGQSTILRAPYGSVSQGRFRQFKNPRSLLRFPSYHQFTPQSVQSVGATGPLFHKTMPHGKGTVYAPYQLAGAANWVAKTAGYSGTFVSHGLWAQMGAASQLARGADPSAIKNARIWRTHVNPGYTGVPKTAAGAAGMVRFAQPGMINQAVGGFMQGAQFGSHAVKGAGVSPLAVRAGTWANKELVELGFKKGFGATGGQAMRTTGQALKAVGGKVAGKEISKRVGAQLAGKLALKGAGAALTSYIPGINVAMAAWLAYDVAKLGAVLTGEALKGTARLAGDAARSLQGNIGKDPMGGTFVDTEAAATSRARGVMAIQNSRLNARSILGSEGGMMAAHFG